MEIIFKDKTIPVIYCNNFKARLLGMSFKKRHINSIYCFPRCNSIHTFFMFQNIDVIMTNKNNEIIYTRENMKPNRIIFNKKDVYYTYEFSHDSALYKMIKEQNYINIRKQ